MLTTIPFIIGFGLIFLFGYNLAKILLPESEHLEQVSVGFIGGSGIYTLIWFLLNRIGIAFNITSGLVVLATLLLSTFVIQKIFIKQKMKNGILGLAYFKNMNMVEKLILLFIGFLCISALLQTIYWPVRYWDSLVLYDYRAKLFAETGSMQTAIEGGQFFGYPLLTSLIHTWVYILGLDNPSFFYSLFYILFLVAFFTNIKKFKLTRLVVFVLTLFVAVSPRFFDHILWAYTNLPYSIYTVLGSIYLYWGIKNHNLGSFVTSAILIGLTTWTRSVEPFWLSCLVIATIVTFFQKKWLWPFIYSAILASIMLPWRYFKLIIFSGTVNVPAELFSASGVAINNFFQFSILKPVFNYVMANVINMYLGYFVIFALILVAKFYKLSKSWIIVFLILFDVAITFGGVLVFATSFIHWQDIPDSVSRMVMFIPPLVVFLCAEFIAEMDNKYENIR